MEAISQLPKPKRVACLYRVSKKQQLNDGDIPVQKKARREFITTKEGWQLIKEYEEKGVCGFRISSLQRAVLMSAMNDAEQSLFDILLVFMFDRLGRRNDETPFVIEYLEISTDVVENQLVGLSVMVKQYMHKKELRMLF